MKSVTPPSSGKKLFGHDEMGRLTFATDGDDDVWKGTYEAWGVLMREQPPLGAVIVASGARGARSRGCRCSLRSSW